MMKQPINGLIQNEIKHPIADSAGIRLFMARADQLHPLASGNKIYKLMPNFDAAKAQGFKQLLSFGGAFSNHIHALALMAQENGFSSVGIIRGEQAYANNPTLSDAQSAGMVLKFVDRQTYKKRHEPAYLEQLHKQYPEAFIIPEGGSSQLAIKGCRELAAQINATQPSDIITVACGTGATLAGIVCGLTKDQVAIGYAILKDNSLDSRVAEFIKNENSKSLSSPLSEVLARFKIENASFGGYAKMDKLQLEFILDWLQQTGILLDPIYTSKMCLNLMKQIAAGEFKSGTSITMIHSGGLQSWRGMEKRVIQLGGQESWEQIICQLTGSRAPVLK